MQAKINLPGSWKLSKQNSYCAGKNGARFKNPAYAAEQTRMRMAIKPQLDEQGWKCTEEKVGIIVTFFGPTMPIDADNYGLLFDALQGETITTAYGKPYISGRRKFKSPGLAVIDDRQFIPAITDWIECKDKKIQIILFSGKDRMIFISYLGSLMSITAGVSRGE